MSTDPRIKALAEEASAKIKSVADLHDSEITAIYKEYRLKSAAIQGTSDSLQPSADSPSQSEETH